MNIKEREEIIERLGRVQEESHGRVLKRFDHLKRYSEWERLKLRKEREIIDMRGSWSRWILRVVIAIVLIDFAIIFLAGLDIAEFNSYYIPIFIGESLIKIIGLAYLIVKFLFNTKD